jgi:hypothetical protein
MAHPAKTGLRGPLRSPYSQTPVQRWWVGLGGRPSRGWERGPDWGRLRGVSNVRHYICDTSRILVPNVTKTMKERQRILLVKGQGRRRLSGHDDAIVVRGSFARKGRWSLRATAALSVAIVTDRGRAGGFRECVLIDSVDEHGLMSVGNGATGNVVAKVTYANKGTREPHLAGDGWGNYGGSAGATTPSSSVAGSQGRGGGRLPVGGGTGERLGEASTMSSVALD